MARIFWDTNLFIYLMERGAHTARVRDMRSAMNARGDELLTSALTLGEILVKPIAQGASGIADEYHRLLTASATVVAFDVATASVFAKIRAARNVKVPDAIQLACASGASVDLFVTNDDRLSRLIVPGIKFITSLERAFL